MCCVIVVMLGLGSQTEPALPQAPGPAPRRVGLFVFGRTMSDMDDELTPKPHKGLPVVQPGLQRRQHNSH